MIWNVTNPVYQAPKESTTCAKATWTPGVTNVWFTEVPGIPEPVAPSNVHATR